MDLSTWTQQLALTGTWRVAQPKALRLKLFSTAARYVTTARRQILDTIPLVIESNPHNDYYLRTKAERMGHDLRFT